MQTPQWPNDEPLRNTHRRRWRLPKTRPVHAVSLPFNLNACVARGNPRADGEPQNPLDHPTSRFKARIQRKTW